jgi:hypothetical protein
VNIRTVSLIDYLTRVGLESRGAGKSGTRQMVGERGFLVSSRESWGRQLDFVLRAEGEGSAWSLAPIVKLDLTPFMQGSELQGRCQTE